MTNTANLTLDLDELVDKVITQIKIDIAVADYTAIVDLLMSAPRASLVAYLPEEDDVV